MRRESGEEKERRNREQKKKLDILCTCTISSQGI